VHQQTKHYGAFLSISLKVANSIADGAANRARPKEYPPVKKFHEAIKGVPILETDVSLVKRCLVPHQDHGFTNRESFVMATSLLQKVMPSGCLHKGSGGTQLVGSEYMR
jgi:hypothetical protein